MPKKAGIAFVTLGAVLILSALLLFLHNQREADLAGKEAESLLLDVQTTITQRLTQSREPSQVEGEAATQPELDPELPVVSVQGFDYVGYVEIPALELTLPVLDDATYYHLQFAPCRQQGSSRTDDLVIAAHNYKTHFGKLNQLVPGDQVVFTDMDGIRWMYLVSAIETVDPYDVDEVLNSDYALVLYTCTVGGQNRVAVFCERASEVVEQKPVETPEGKELEP